MIEQAFSLVAAACERIQECGKCDECPKKHTCICGDTNVMDMAELGAKCIFVPTPGQFEQIVLAHDLSKAGYATQIPADELSAETLASAFEKSVKMPKVEKQNLLHDAVENVVRRFKERSI